ncbi:MAG: serine/threonine protein phosphatase, partial [Stenotrophomonas sp.]
MNEGARPWRRALLWLALLGPFFFLSYGFANAMAGRLSYVPSIVFDWEARIPFQAWTIVPYWSIDLFYVASFFICTRRAELDMHARRLFTAQLLSVACFLL